MNSYSFCNEKAVYKLYKENRCLGCNLKHLQNEKIFIFEDTNMNKLIEYINLEGNKSKAYFILKYIGDDLRWRQLIKYTRYTRSNYEQGNLTKTWCRLFYDDRSRKWKETNYRYQDEII